MYHEKTEFSKLLTRTQKIQLDKTLLIHAKLLCEAYNEFNAGDLFENIHINDIAIRDLDLRDIEDEDLIYLIQERLLVLLKRKRLLLIPNLSEPTFVITS